MYIGRDLWWRRSCKYIAYLVPTISLECDSVMGRKCRLKYRLCKVSEQKTTGLMKAWRKELAPPIFFFVFISPSRFSDPSPGSDILSADPFFPSYPTFYSESGLRLLSIYPKIAGCLELLSTNTRNISEPSAEPNDSVAVDWSFVRWSLWVGCYWLASVDRSLWIGRCGWAPLWGRLLWVGRCELLALCQLLRWLVTLCRMVGRCADRSLWFGFAVTGCCRYGFIAVVSLVQIHMKQWDLKESWIIVCVWPKFWWEGKWWHDYALLSSSSSELIPSTRAFNILSKALHQSPKPIRMYISYIKCDSVNLTLL